MPASEYRPASPEPGVNHPDDGHLLKLLMDIGEDAADGLDEAFGYAIPDRLQPVSSEDAIC